MGTNNIKIVSVSLSLSMERSEHFLSHILSSFYLGKSNLKSRKNYADIFFISILFIRMKQPKCQAVGED